MRQTHRTTSRAATLAVAIAAVALVATSCGGASKDSGGGKTGAALAKDRKLRASDGESGLKKAGAPQRGGKLIYGLEAESTDGFCLSSGQLAISGMMVVRAIYDTLTVPNAEGTYVPYLAKSVEPNSDFTEWTIKVRPNIKFSDGSPLTGEVVKNNIDAYRGKYPGRSSLLFGFVLNNIKDTKVTDPDTVVVSTTVPWVAFPAFLYSSSRFGIMGQSQLDDADTCSSKLVGTGPFTFVSWQKNQKLVGKRNPNYWQTAPDGKPYPYADSIEFRPISNGTIRNNALASGNINVMHTSNAKDISTTWADARDKGKANMLVSEDSAEVSFLQLNETKPPFDDFRMRKALALGASRFEINQIIGNGFPTIADGPFAPDSVAYLKDTGFPTTGDKPAGEPLDPDAAKKRTADNKAEAEKLVKEYKAEGKKASFTITATTDPSVQQLAQLVQQRAQAVGVDVKIRLEDQGALITDAIAKNFQAMTFRNYPGGDPDLNYVWWLSGTTVEDGTFAPNIVNFAGIKDDKVDQALIQGRSETDPAKRKALYQDLEREMGSQVHGLWSWFTPWAIVENSKVHDILGPPLPGDDPSKPGDATTSDKALQPFTGLATGHSLLGMWIQQ